MKTIGWAAIIYNVHDALTFGAVCLLIVGECTVTYIANRKPQAAESRNASRRRPMTLLPISWHEPGPGELR
jgi:hypothetical protein